MTVTDADLHYYTKHFDSATSVADYIANNYQSLKNQTFRRKLVP